MNRQDDNSNTQYQNYSRINSYYLDKIEDILNIKNQDEMDLRINKNIGSLIKIFQLFKKKNLYENNYSKDEIDNFIYALKFVENNYNAGNIHAKTIVTKGHVNLVLILYTKEN